LRNRERIHVASPALVLLALSLPSLARAQSPFFGSRATGMGGAATAAVDDGMALWINPAGLSRDPRADLELYGGAVATDRGQLLGEVDDLSGTDLASIAENPAELLEVIGELGSLAEPGTGVVGSGAAGLGFSWSGLAAGIDDLAYAGVYPNVDLTHIQPGSDPATSIRFNDTSVRSAGLQAREARLGLSMGLLQKVLLVGVTLRYINGRTTYSSQSVFDVDFGNPMSVAKQALSGNPLDTNRFTFDAGALVSLLGVVRVAVVSTAITEPSFSVQQDPSNPQLAGAPASLQLPRTLRAGAAVAPIDALTIAVDGDLIRTSTLVPGAESQQLSTGMEVRLPLFVIRAGAFYDFAAIDPHWAFSAGFGVALPALSLSGAVVLSTYQGLSLSTANQRDIGASLGGRFRF
jgi:F plasmid transfer operon, TraF, protein